MSDRLERERRFHDARFGEGDGRSNDRYHGINASSDRFFRDVIERLPPGSELLDYGCGKGAYCAIHAAEFGHRVTAVDLSPVAIDHARQQAETLGLAGRIKFEVMNAEDLQFPDASFDVVGGLGVLHHLDINVAMENVTRVMKPDGLAFFVEPLGHNPAINLVRQRTPEQHTLDEHPLLVEDIELISRNFDQLEARYFHLMGLLAIPAINRSLLDPLVARLDQVDQALFKRVKSARKYAWKVGLKLSGPRRSSSLGTS